MTTQLCPNCRHANKLDNRYCGRCGNTLALFPAPVRQQSPMTVGNGSLLPAPSLKQVGQAVAVSVIALAAEAGLIWLRRRVRQMAEEQSGQQALVPTRKKSPEQSTILSRRVVQLWRGGKLREQLTEQSVWQEMD